MLKNQRVNTQSGKISIFSPHPQKTLKNDVRGRRQAIKNRREGRAV
jgi:hypothetical protein